MSVTYPNTLLAVPHFRGERNNNPLNLVRTTPQIPWLGLASAIDQAGDTKFDVFNDPQHGIRAAILDMQTHAMRASSTYAINLSDLITIWAPAIENDTKAYLASVSEKSGCATDSHVVTNSEGNILKLVPAFIDQENGRCIYPADLISASRPNSIQ